MQPTPQSSPVPATAPIQPAGFQPVSTKPVPLPLDFELLRQVSGGESSPRGNW